MIQLAIKYDNKLSQRDGSEGFMGLRWALRGFTDRLHEKESIKDSS